MDEAVLTTRFPFLYHMAELDSWPSIRRFGLLSTSALLDLFEINGTRRASIEETHRPESVNISHSQHGKAVVRDQKPMSDAGLKRCLEDGITPAQWYRTLNGMVFFWVTETRLRTLLTAAPYEGRPHDVLIVDTGKLLSRHQERVRLSPMNSGCTRPFPHPRGTKTFLPIDEYPFDEWDRKRRGRDPVVELAVQQGVPDIETMTVRVTRIRGSDPGSVIWER